MIHYVISNGIPYEFFDYAQALDFATKCGTIVQTEYE